MFTVVFPLLSCWSSNSNIRFFNYDTDKVDPSQNNTVTDENMKKSGSKDVFLKSVGEKFKHKFAWTLLPNIRFFFDRYAYDKKIYLKKGMYLKVDFYHFTKYLIGLLQKK